MNASGTGLTVNVPLGTVSDVEETDGAASLMVVRDAVSGEVFEPAEISGDLVMTVTLAPYEGSVFTLETVAGD